jgi:glycosyltransferase involved in cell wall biosynthesis
MKLSIYTFVKDGLYYDFHVVPMLKHHLPLADEIIVNEGYSTDGTYEAIKDLDPKIKVSRFHWDRSDPNAWHRKFKNQARQLCTGDWCILLDCDEFIPEWEFDRLRQFLAKTDKTLVPVRFIHFYANYKVYIARERTITPTTGLRIHRNLPTVEVWGDGANVHVTGREQDTSLVSGETFAVHHFGCVRRPARLRQKWRTQAKQHDAKNPRWDILPGFLFDMMPYKWKDPDFLNDLAIYDGPHIEAVRSDPDEFVRDDFLMYEYLKQKCEVGGGSMAGELSN